jgi:hypothetical protein
VPTIFRGNEKIRKVYKCRSPVGDARRDLGTLRRNGRVPSQINPIPIMTLAAPPRRKGACRAQSEETAGSVTEP